MGLEKDVRELLLIRHATALKNVAHERGGMGTSLIPDGEEQSRRLSTDLDALGHQPLVVAYHDIPHVQETLDLLSLERPCSYLNVPALVGIDLGVINGLSAQEAERRYPEASLALESWKAGHLSIEEVNLPEAEDLKAFERRIRGALNVVLEAGPMVAILGTQSTLIMIHNILELGKGFSYKEYRHVQFPHCGGFRWTLDGTGPIRAVAFPGDGRR